VLFASYDFLLFFVPVLLGFWALRSRPVARTALLAVASYWFYMASGRPPGETLPTPWYFVGLLGLSTVLDYLVAARIHRLSSSPETGRVRARNSSTIRRNALLAMSLVGNLGLLGYFKYTNFLIEACTDLANSLGGSWIAPHLDILMPIGISFYTFQSLSYTIDVWRGRLTPEPSFLKFALFVVFFPQLVAGPIVRASEFLPQLHRRPRLTVRQVEQGFFRILQGLAKKVLLGDLMGAFLVDVIFDAPGDYTAAENLIGLYAFTLQIYADFSGYSDIAIGVAGLMGFRIPENFDRPYQATHLGEFWRRWHITLSTWLRDYLFFPLGGSKCGPLRSYFNLWLTMFLVGMWHGASWNFVVYSNLHGCAMLFNRWNRRRGALGGWGLLGLLLVAAAFFGAVYALSLNALDQSWPQSMVLAAAAGLFFLLVVVLPDRPALAAVHILLTFHFTVFSRIFFRSENLENSRMMIRKLLDWDELRDRIVVAGHRGVDWEWVRPGIWRHPGACEWVESADLVAWVEVPLLWMARNLLLLVLVFGTLYHFTPKRWVDEVLAPRLGRLPAPVLAILLAILCVMIMHVLDGPRANIYFAF